MADFSAPLTPHQSAARHLFELYLDKVLRVAVSEIFERNPGFQSAVLWIGQYWDDQANDEVHYELFCSELAEPDLTDMARMEDLQWVSSPTEKPSTNLPGLKEQQDMQSFRAYLTRACMPLPPSRLHAYWKKGRDRVLADSMGSAAVTAFACFAPDNGHQNYYLLPESFAPCLTFYRTGSLYTHPRQRPWLEGVSSEDDREEGKDVAAHLAEVIAELEAQ